MRLHNPWQILSRIPSHIWREFYYETARKLMHSGKTPDVDGLLSRMPESQLWQLCDYLLSKCEQMPQQQTLPTAPEQQVLPIAPALQLSPTTNYYDWNQIADEAVGFLICGNSGSAKSSLATWLAGHLTQAQPMAVLALDPHFNDCWKLAGIKSIGKIQMIEACLTWLIGELDTRCDRKGEGLPLGNPMFVICDELNAAIERFTKPKVIESALKRLGSEGRKFGITFCGLNQSSNAGALGIDAKYRSNYALILLGQSARTHPQLGKVLTDVAYPCLVTGSIADAIATHPTHGNYQQFKKQGNPPMNIKAINQLPLPADLQAVIAGSGNARTLLTNTIADTLEPSFDAVEIPSAPVSTSAQPKLSAPLQAILDYAQRQNDYVAARKIQSSIRLFRDTPAGEIRGYFQWLSDRGYGVTRGDNESLEFSAK